MNKPVPWNIKGVGFDAREAARLAAKRAGLSVGEWLNEIIASRAAELGVSADDVEPDDRLEAIAARLSAPGHFEQLSGLAPENTPQRDQRRIVDLAPVDVPERSRLLPPRGTAFGDRVRRGRSLEWMDTALTAAPETRMGGTVEARLGGADVLDTSERWTAPLAAVAEEPVTPAASAPISAAAASTARTLPMVDTDSLDLRLNAILEKLNRSFEEAERFGEAATAGLGRTESAWDARRGLGAPSGSAPSAAPNSRHSVGEAVPSDAADPAAAALGELHAGFRVLADTIEARTGEAGPDPVDAIKLARTVAQLAERFESSDESVRTLPPPLAPELARLQHDVAQLSQQLTQLAPAKAVAALQSAVADLAGRVDLSRLDGVKASVLAPVERLSRDMREAIRSADPSRAVEALQRDMQALTARVEAAHGDRAVLAEMRAEMGEMRGVLDAAAGRLALSEQLHREIVALGERVDGLAERSSPTMSRDLGKAIGDIRDILGQFGSGGLLGSIDRRVTTLATRIEAIAEAQDPTSLLDDLSREINRAHDTLAIRLAQRVPAPELAGIEAGLGTISAKIDAVNRSNHDMLYGLVGELAERVEEVRRPEADGSALNALQNQIGRLAERFDLVESGASSLNGLERLIGDLFLQVEQSRDVAIDAAENAARAAAQDTLRAALDNPALNGGELTKQTGLDVAHVSQELAELRRIQEASERRVNTTLTALNSTLERLVDRMIADHAGAAGRTAVVPPRAENPDSHASRARLPRTPAADAGTAAPFAPDDFLLEPGHAAAPAARPGFATGAPPVDIARGDDDRHPGDVGTLIAAARRAAHLAQASALEAAGSGDAPDAGAAAQPGKVKSFFASKRRALLLSLAGVVLLLGSLQAVRMATDRSDDADSPAREAAAPAAAPAASASPAGPAAVLPTNSNTADTTPPVTDAPAQKAGDTPGKPAADAGAKPGDTSLLTPGDTKSAAPGFMASSGGLPRMVMPPAASGDPAGGVSSALRSLATTGNAPAQFEMGTRLADGRGIARDPKDAAGWFEKAALQGLAPAQYRLGSVYEKGVGRSQDSNLAIGWYEKAANGGNVRAMHNLAVMLAEGAGSKPDYGRAVTWFTKAASYGVRDSEFNLAVLFARGLGVPQNYGQSYAWFALAADQGDADAAKKRDAVAAKLDPKALDDAKAMVTGFKPLVSDPAANAVQPPPGGWDAEAPAKTASRKSDARLSM